MIFIKYAIMYKMFSNLNIKKKLHKKCSEFYLSLTLFFQKYAIMYKMFSNLNIKKKLYKKCSKFYLILFFYPPITHRIVNAKLSLFMK